MIESLSIIAIAAGALGPAEAIIGETLTVQFQTVTLATVARFMHLDLGRHDLMQHWLLRNDPKIAWLLGHGKLICKTLLPQHLRLMLQADIHGIILIIHHHIGTALHLDGLGERILHR